jgi:hypothetical protein
LLSGKTFRSKKNKGLSFLINSAQIVYIRFDQKILIDMGKSMNFTGQPVLSQLLKLIDKQKILDLSRKMG